MTHPEHPAGPDEHRYAVRLAGHLHPRWAARFDGMALTRADDGTTLLEGELPDQAALHGLLRTLRDLGLPLLSLTRLDQPSPPPPRTPRTPDTPQGD